MAAALASVCAVPSGATGPTHVVTSARTSTSTLMANTAMANPRLSSSEFLDSVRRIVNMWTFLIEDVSPSYLV